MVSYSCQVNKVGSCTNSYSAEGAGMCVYLTWEFKAKGVRVSLTQTVGKNFLNLYINT